ncbi:hypothetical protein [Brevundimonas sp.]|uniref:hypothetical protein n=1 Tax=Brevundimonas sp. TaxID=1871086 RepID=UPI002CDC36DA|nr:hypothetical protein [Brevundimonas sp.]HWQ87043.1 hypothetical protein [Brevundimonas sp.]
MSEDHPSVPGPSPTDALAAIAQSRKAVHDRVAVGGWRYDLAYAALVAGMVGGQALDNPFNVSASTLGLLGLVLLFQHETRRTGLRITGVSPRHARWVAIAIGLVAAAIIVGVTVVRRQSPGTDVAVVAGLAAAAAFVAALVGARVWRRVWRAEMGAGK